ncbi:MAG: cation diffusion facilitator family transporter [Phycisphaerae bacterium]|jgi:cation diffusion facilitator family transporter
MDIDRRKTNVAALSVACNVFLIVFKVAVGALSGSVSIISEAAHSGVDLMAAIIALLAVRAASVPPDPQHPYGHGKWENMSGAIEALLIFVAAIWIIYEAVLKFIHPQPMDNLGWGVAVMLVSALANAWIAARLFRVAQEGRSMALQADAWHHWTDVYTSAGVMAGLAVMLAGQRFWPSLDLRWIDPVAAILVSLLILRAAYKLTLQAIRDLLDVSLPQEEQDWIRQMISTHYPMVCDIHGLRTRRSGAARFVELHIVVYRGMSLKDSHALAHNIANSIKQRLDGASVIAHVEPCDGRCGRPCDRMPPRTATPQAPSPSVLNAET